MERTDDLAGELSQISEQKYDSIFLHAGWLGPGIPLASGQHFTCSWQEGVFVLQENIRRSASHPEPDAHKE